MTYPLKSALKSALVAHALCAFIVSLALEGCTQRDAQRDQDSQESDLPQRARGGAEDAGESGGGGADNETSDAEPNTESTIDAERDASVISETVADAAIFDTPLDGEAPDADISDPISDPMTSRSDELS